MKKPIIPLVLLVLSMLAVPALAQTERELLDQLLVEEHGSIAALALYPKETRLAILEASKYPEALIKLESLQAKTSESFKNLMALYPHETQQVVWDLTRYPGLIEKLVSYQGNDPAPVIETYPSVIHQRARNAFYNHINLLDDVNYLNQEWDRTFSSLIEGYPLKMRDAMRELVELPEVLSILTENIRMTILVGDLFRNNPIWLMEQMDSLSLAVAREKAKESQDWKESLESQPAAREEFVTAAEVFAAEYGYDDDYYSYDNDSYNYDDRSVVEHHYYYHYPYWFGYPYWYMYPRWRPYPYWYDWGFYWGPGRMVMIIDLPSYYFTNWYFYYPHHHHHYPHLSSHFVNHYYGHRGHSSSVTVSVENWRSRNSEVVTNEWLETARSRPESFREFGQFEAARQEYNRSHGDKPLSQREYLDKNQKKYKELTAEVEKARQVEQANRAATVPPTERKRIEPATQPPRTVEPAKPPVRKTEPAVEPKVEPKVEPIRPKTEPPKTRIESKTIPNVDKGNEYHRNTWEKTKPKVERRETAPARPQVTPAKPPANKPATTPRTQPKTAPTRKGVG